jgi:hypothetical protein
MLVLSRVIALALVSPALRPLRMRLLESAVIRELVSPVVAAPGRAVVSAGVTAAPAFPPDALGAGAAAVESATAPVSRARLLLQAATPPSVSAPTSAARQRR